MKGLYELILRLEGPMSLFFARMHKIALLFIAVGLAIVAIPDMDVVVVTLHKGTPDEKKLWLGTILTALSAGMAAASRFSLNEQAKSQMQTLRDIKYKIIE